MARLVCDDPTVPAHICLLAHPERDPTLACHAAAASEDYKGWEGSYSKHHLQFDVLGYKDMVHIHMQLGPLLLEPALLSHLYWDKVVMVESILQGFQHQTGFLRHKGFR